MPDRIAPTSEQQGQKIERDVSNPEALESIQREALIIEADHFFQAELGHDQRAIWLLALCSGLLIAVSSYFVPIKKGEFCSSSLPWLIASLVMLSLSAGFIIFALWPLAGRHGSLWHPFYGPSASQYLCEKERFGGDWALRHYVAHRLRAERKATRIVCAIILLLIGLFLAVTGIMIGAL